MIIYHYHYHYHNLCHYNNNNNSNHNKNDNVMIMIIIIIKTAVYSKGDIFLSVSRITWTADNTRRAQESHLDYRVWLQ